MKQPLLIFPFNGNALEAVDCLGDNYKLVGFIDDNQAKQGISPERFTIYSRDALKKFPDAMVLAVPGSPTTFMNKREIIQSLDLDEKRFASVIHPSAKISDRSSIGFNTLIMAGVVVTSNAVIGNHVIILPNSVIHHDSVIGEYTSVGSNVTIAGRTVVGNECYVGSSSSIINDITVGNGSLIGMATNVIRSVPTGSKVAGNPGRIIN